MQDLEDVINKAVTLMRVELEDLEVIHLLESVAMQEAIHVNRQTMICMKVVLLPTEVMITVTIVNLTIVDLLLSMINFTMVAMVVVEEIEMTVTEK